MFDVHVVKTGTFVTSSDTDSDHIRRPHDIGFMSYSEVSALESGFKIFADSVVGFTGYVWRKGESANTKRKKEISRYLCNLCKQHACLR